MDEHLVFRPAGAVGGEHTGRRPPAPLGLAGFALTTLLLSGHNASWIPDLIWVGPAIFYGGLAQFAAGMWEFCNRNVFGATAFATYGGFWMIVTAGVAWYTSAAGVMNGVAGGVMVPVGRPLVPESRVPAVA